MILCVCLNNNFIIRQIVISLMIQGNM